MGICESAGFLVGANFLTEKAFANVWTGSVRKHGRGANA